MSPELRRGGGSEDEREVAEVFGWQLESSALSDDEQSPTRRRGRREDNRLRSDPEPDHVHGSPSARSRHFNHSAGVAPDERFESWAWVRTDSDLLYTARTDEIGEVAGGRPVIEEVPASKGEPNLYCGPRSPGVVPAM